MFFCLWTMSTRAADSVTVGVIGPMSQQQRAAIETAAEIVNTPHPGLESLPLGGGQGLPKLGGAKLVVAAADDLANPSAAMAQALSLITEKHVAALVGVGASPQVAAASGAAERHHVSFLAPLETAPRIAGQGFNFVFRSGPLAADIAGAYARFLTELKQGGGRVDTVTLVYEDSEAARAEADALREALTSASFAIADITYKPNADNLSATVTALRGQNPTAAIFISRAPDAILLIKTMQSLGYKPPIAIGDGAGFADPNFVAAVGNLAQGMIGRSAWSAGPSDSPPAIVNRLYRAKAGHDLDDAAAQAIEGLLILADAIDRAGSTDPMAIRDALRQTALQREQLIVGYDGVKFDASGQNTFASTYLTQLHGKQYLSIWPATSAGAKPTLPFKGWE